MIFTRRRTGIVTKLAGLSTASRLTLTTASGRNGFGYDVLHDDFQFHRVALFLSIMRVGRAIGERPFKFDNSPRQVRKTLQAIGPDGLAPGTPPQLLGHDFHEVSFMHSGVSTGSPIRIDFGRLFAWDTLFCDRLGMAIVLDELGCFLDQQPTDRRARLLRCVPARARRRCCLRHSSCSRSCGGRVQWLASRWPLRPLTRTPKPAREGVRRWPGRRRPTTAATGSGNLRLRTEHAAGSGAWD